jgi:hypothetical protein
MYVVSRLVKTRTSTADTFPVNAGMNTYIVNIKLEEHIWYTVIKTCLYVSFIFFCFMFVRAYLIFKGKVKDHEYIKCNQSYRDIRVGYYT